MYRFIVRTIIFSLSIGISLYIGVQWKLSQDLDYLSSRLGSNIQLSYQNSAMTLAGTVVVSDLDLYFRQQDINISIHKIKFSSGSIFKMAFLRSLFDSQEMPKEIYLKIDEAVVPLTPSLVKLISNQEPESTWKAINASACGNLKQLGIKEYFSMGYDYFVFSSETKFQQDSFSGNLLGSGSINIEETSDIKFDFDLAGFYNKDKDPQRGENPLSLERLQIDVKDKGYNRRRNEFCGLKSGLTVDKYLVQHIKTIKQKLSTVGIKITPTGQRFYREFLQPNSQYQLLLEPQVSFTFADFGYYDEQELRKLLGARLTINEQNVPRIFNHWALDKFNKIAISNDDDQQTVSKNKQFKNVFIKRSYHLISKSDLPNLTNFEIKIIRNDGKQFIGKLIKLKDNRAYVSISKQGGVIQVAVDIDTIKQLYDYR